MAIDRSWTGTDDDGSGQTGTVVNLAYMTALLNAIDTYVGTMLPKAGGTVTGATTFSAAGTALAVTNNMTIGGTLAVTGAVTLSNTLASKAIAVTVAANTAFLTAGGAGTGFSQCDITNTGGTMRFGVEASAGGSLFVGDSAYAGVVGTSGATALEFGTNANIRVTISSAGLLTAKVGLTVTGAGVVVGAPTGGDKGAGTVNPSGAYYANGTVGVSAGSFGTITAITTVTGIVTQLTGSSDARLKDLTGPYRRGLRELLAITPQQWRWNQRSGFPRDQAWVGFVAQDVQRVLPEAIGSERWADGSEWLTLNDRAILAAAVNAIQELHTLVTARG